MIVKAELLPTKGKRLYVDLQPHVALVIVDDNGNQRYFARNSDPNGWAYVEQTNNFVFRIKAEKPKIYLVWYNGKVIGAYSSQSAAIDAANETMASCIPNNWRTDNTESVNGTLVWRDGRDYCIRIVPQSLNDGDSIIVK